MVRMMVYQDQKLIGIESNLVQIWQVKDYLVY